VTPVDQNTPCGTRPTPEMLSAARAGTRQGPSTSFSSESNPRRRPRGFMTNRTRIGGGRPKPREFVRRQTVGLTWHNPNSSLLVEGPEIATWPDHRDKPASPNTPQPTSATPSRPQRAWQLSNDQIQQLIAGYQSGSTCTNSPTSLIPVTQRSLRGVRNARSSIE
jgi:hypothetical protein